MTPDKLFLGIDPGKTGAIAFLSEYQALALPIPTLDPKTYDFNAILHLLNSHPNITAAAVERLQPLPAALGGSFANFARGESLAWEWILRARSIPVVRPLPRQWQKWALINPGDDTGTRSVEQAQRKWPNTTLLRTPRSTKLDDNLADALHLADYARNWWNHE